MLWIVDLILIPLGYHINFLRCVFYCVCIFSISRNLGSYDHNWVSTPSIYIVLICHSCEGRNPYLFAYCHSERKRRIHTRFPVIPIFLTVIQSISEESIYVHWILHPKGSGWHSSYFFTSSDFSSDLTQTSHYYPPSPTSRGFPLKKGGPFYSFLFPDLFSDLTPGSLIISLLDPGVFPFSSALLQNFLPTSNRLSQLLIFFREFCLNNPSPFCWSNWSTSK